MLTLQTVLWPKGEGLANDFVQLLFGGAAVFHSFSRSKSIISGKPLLG
jgi:hypothetical protein